LSSDLSSDFLSSDLLSLSSSLSLPLLEGLELSPLIQLLYKTVPAAAAAPIVIILAALSSIFWPIPEKWIYDNNPANSAATIRLAQLQ